MLIFTAIDWETPDHQSIDNFAAFLHFFNKIFLLRQFECIFFLFGDLKRLQYSFLEAGFPILVHECLIFVNDGVEGSFVYFE